jgi:DNA-binding SARP family transcriptional activator/tetratricopeptide (TPR) repeat protein
VGSPEAEGASLPLEYSILGPIDVRCDGRSIELPGSKVRTLLAVLLVHANQVVTTERVAEYLWSDSAPMSAHNLIQGTVSRLRACLHPCAGREILITRPAGYLLAVDPGQLDLHRFEELVDAAAKADDASRVDLEAARLQAGLELWRGAPLAGARLTPLVESVIARLEEQRLLALEQRIRADLEAGRHAQVAGELASLVAEHPLRERLWELYMLALYRSGRQAEALHAYVAAQGLLARELGIEPGPQLRALERSIREASEGLATEHPAFAGGHHTWADQPPNLLPRAIRDFTGYAIQTERAHQVLAGEGHPEQPRSPRTLLITGPAGSGKTTLAVYMAERVRAHYPDGQLFADLGGTESSHQDAAGVLGRFLRALGVYSPIIPPDLEERVAMYRARLAGRAVLVVLDNVASEAQVRPLLPAGAGCACLITSRLALAGLEGADILSLAPLLSDHDALSLLIKVVGAGRVAAEPVAAQAIVDLCGRLPLAIRIAGARIAVRPDWRLHQLGQRLGDERRRLDELRAGDLEVRASLALSYSALTDACQRAFRLLAAPDTPDVTAWQASALLDCRLAEAEALVERLVDAHLLESRGEDTAGQLRYGFHSLVRLFGSERLCEAEAAEAQNAALERAIGAQLTLALRARALLSPGDAVDAPRGRALRWLPDGMSSIPALERDPLKWLEAEGVNLVQSIHQASHLGMAEAAWELACCLPTFLVVRGFWQDWRLAKAQALEVNERVGNRAAVAHVLWSIGQSYMATLSRRSAQAYFERSGDVYRELGDREGEARALAALGTALIFQGDVEGALDHYQRSLTVFIGGGDWHGEMLCRMGMGLAQVLLGRPDQALDGLERCLAVFREHGERYWEAWAVRLLGAVRVRLAMPDGVACLQSSVAIFRDLRDHFMEATVLAELAELCESEGRRGEAISCLDQCVAIADTLNMTDWGKRLRWRREELAPSGRQSAG